MCFQAGYSYYPGFIHDTGGREFELPTDSFSPNFCFMAPRLIPN
jgi:hypothetical protein